MKESGYGAAQRADVQPDAAPDYCAIGLVNPKSPENVGAVMRAAGCYGAEEVYYTGQRFELARRFATDTKQMVEKIPLLGVEDLLAFVPEGCTPVLVISSRGPPRCRTMCTRRGPSTSSARRMARWIPPASLR